MACLCDPNDPMVIISSAGMADVYYGRMHVFPRKGEHIVFDGRNLTVTDVKWRFSNESADEVILYVED